MIRLIIRGRYASIGLGRINFFSINKDSLRKMGQRRVFTVGNVDEIRKHKENDEEKPEADSSHGSRR